MGKHRGKIWNFSKKIAKKIVPTGSVSYRGLRQFVDRQFVDRQFVDPTIRRPDNSSTVKSAKLRLKLTLKMCRRIVGRRIVGSTNCRVDELSVDELSVDQLSVDELSCSRRTDKAKKWYIYGFSSHSYAYIILEIAKIPTIPNRGKISRNPQKSLKTVPTA